MILKYNMVSNESILEIISWINNYHNENGYYIHTNILDFWLQPYKIRQMMIKRRMIQLCSRLFHFWPPHGSTLDKKCLLNIILFRLSRVHMIQKLRKIVYGSFFLDYKQNNIDFKYNYSISICRSSLFFLSITLCFQPALKAFVDTCELSKYICYYI